MGTKKKKIYKNKRKNINKIKDYHKKKKKPQPANTEVIRIHKIIRKRKGGLLRKEEEETEAIIIFHANKR